MDTQLLLKGWIAANAARTTHTLGDRSKYVGMSDIAKAFGCFRSAVASKVSGDSRYPDAATLQAMTPAQCDALLERIRPLERGHEQEVGLANAFEAMEYNFIQQLEIRIETDGLPIEAHLDFVIFHGDRIEVVESKSNEEPPAKLYLEYEAQLYGQIGLLHRYYAEPVFSVRNNLGDYTVKNVSLPEIAKELGISLPGRGYPAQNVHGYVVSMNGTSVKTFGPYYPNSLMTNVVIRKGIAVADAAQAVRNGMSRLNDMEYKKGFNPLCDYCDFNKACPKFTDASANPEFGSILYQLDELKKKGKELKAQEDALKETLMAAYSGQGLDGKDWIDAGIGRFRVENHSRKSLDQESLKAHLIDGEGFSEEEVEEMFEVFTKQSSFTKLATPKINLQTT